MRLILLFIAVLFIAGEASAASCHSFAKILSYDEAASTVEVKWEKGSTRKYFPQPEGSTGDVTKIPARCRGAALKETTVPVKATGGRLSVTQVRSNQEGRMLNDTESAEWFKGQIDSIIAGGVPVVAVLRPGKKRGDPAPMTTIYLPVTEEELADIERRENEVVDED